MKKNLLLFAVSALASIFTARAQSEESIIYLDFQDWPASPGVVSDPATECETGVSNITGPDTVAIDYQTGGHGSIILWKYFVSPACNCKYMNRGDVAECELDITTGWVSLGKAPNAGDTIGQFILPKLSNVTRIEIGFSCTGSGRGMRIYASTDDGQTWGDPIGGEHWESNAQNGVWATENVNLDNVIIKITSGTSEDGTSQYTRLHNVQVWGVPGGPETGFTEPAIQNSRVYFRPGEGLIIRGQLSQIQIYDITGRLVESSLVNGSQTMDVSGYTKGIYILKAAEGDNRVFTQKFIIK
jgi:hypothetical protein